MGHISSEKIPNNVNLKEDKKLQRALETWQPDFIDWWMDMGPEGFQTTDVYLRTAVSVEPGGWAHFEYVKMPDYRWGIFLAPTADRIVHFGDHIGEPAWNEVPGEYRNDLRRLIVTQADTEPASVEQQRLLGKSAPSLYDLRNLFQVNVEEGRHLWAMVYLLQRFFGRDGREEADDLLVRRSGNPDSPRILNAFNKPVNDWLAFFCFTTFTDRDGKFQLAALSESAFEPLARTTKFMLTEEAHHMFVGESGISRVVQRTIELEKEAPEGDVRKLGGIPLELVQKYVNEWYSASLDLFGAENSSNSANFFGASLKGRYQEGSKTRYPDHKALDQVYLFEERKEDGTLDTIEIPMRRAMNLVLRDAYVTECESVVDRWNRVLEKGGHGYRFKLPSQRFNRLTGTYSAGRYDTDGNALSDEEYESYRDSALPSEDDFQYIGSIMDKPVFEPGKIANWIAPPPKGIDGKSFEYEYVRL